jgi:hypothetical protein
MPVNLAAAQKSCVKNQTRSLKKPSRRSPDYGAGGGNFIGVAVVEGVGDAVGNADGDCAAGAVATGDMVSNACSDFDDMAWNSLGSGIAIRRRPTVPMPPNSGLKQRPFTDSSLGTVALCDC